MNTQTHKITTWAELAATLVMACEWSDPKTAEPFGSATFERVGSNIVHMNISVDLVPMIVVTEKELPF